jgi:MGT family glycosyltransferase
MDLDMGSRILIATLPARGHIFPTLAVADELARRGNQVTYVTTEEFTATVTGAGVYPLPYESMDPASMVDTDQEPMAFVEENRRVLRTAVRHFGAQHPDLVLYDSAMNLAGRILAKTWDRPGVALNPVFASNEHYDYMQQAMQVAGPRDHESGTALFEEYVRRSAELLGEYGIDGRSNGSPLGDKEFNVVYVPRAFQPAGDTFDDRFAFVGPCLGERAFLGEWQPPVSGLPVVLASLGTTYNDRPDFFQTCARAFEGLPWHLVISVGQKVDPADLGRLPDNVEVQRWVPHLTVLEHARVFVTHGGMGSVLESLYQGCPMVFVPSWPDVQLIAGRATELGLGRLIRPDELTAERLRDAVRAVADDGVTRERVREMQRLTREAGGAARAADEIEAHAKRAG